ncbi:MAG: hypothetical protein AAFA34_01155 [Thermoplasmata archaeon]
MRTGLLLYLDSEGSSYPEVAEPLEALGFRPSSEGYDFEYAWDAPGSVREAVALADRVHEALHGLTVYFRLETFDAPARDSSRHG